MDFYKKRIFAKIKKIFFLLAFILATISPIFSETFPANLSSNATISIITVNYNDIFHSIFSKNCLRIYDAENGFDQIIDFAHFDDFEDTFFLLKFYFKGGRAKIQDERFIDFFLKHEKQTNVSLTEKILNLSPEEIAYIFDFVSTLQKALPEYSYDFDILENNSETHISRILSDAERMIGSKSPENSFSISETTKYSLVYKQINDSYILFPQREVIVSTEHDFKKTLRKEKIFLIFLLAFSSLIFLITSYQVLSYFFEKIYIAAIFRTVQIFDFLILFASGFIGTIVLYQDIFSNQSLFRNNFAFLFLFPLHLPAAFFILKPVKNRGLHIYYWSLVGFLCVLYTFVSLVLDKKLSLVCFLFILSLFLRNIYFYFVAKDIKKERTFKPYALLVKFLDFISS